MDLDELPQFTIEERHDEGKDGKARLVGRFSHLRGVQGESGFLYSAAGSILGNLAEIPSLEPPSPCSPNPGAFPLDSLRARRCHGLTTGGSRIRSRWCSIRTTGGNAVCLWRSLRSILRSTEQSSRSRLGIRFRRVLATSEFVKVTGITSTVTSALPVWEPLARRRATSMPRSGGSASSATTSTPRGRISPSLSISFDVTRRGADLDLGTIRQVYPDGSGSAPAYGDL